MEPGLVIRPHNAKKLSNDSILRYRSGENDMWPLPKIRSVSRRIGRPNSRI